MWFTDGQFSLDIDTAFELDSSKVSYRDVIIDRKSKYTVSALKIENSDQVKPLFKKFQSQPEFRKATHNSYAWRVKESNGALSEWKNDDGEQGAGMCILREMQRENAQNMLLIVTRYYGGIQLQNDRFKHVINACKILFEKEKSS